MYDNEKRQTLHILPGKQQFSGPPLPGHGLLAVIFLLAAQVGQAQELSSPLADVSPCAADGRLTVSLYGGIRTTLDWTAAEFECLGMPRPDNEGARLRFAGTAEVAGEARRIAIIVGLPALKQGQTARETPANITIIEENAGRFFSSSEASFCFSDIDEQEQDANGEAGEYRISGVLYCVAALAELNGTGDVSLSDLKFSGRIDWKPPQ